ncbi:MAG: hypothetical protein HYS13_21755 [Planctomycetia bacterium]|nr:hypothetical protein [Planctomycetia bacterium]
MGFLQRFLRNVFRDGAPSSHASSFERLSEDELEAHLGVARYGDFVLTDAIRPSYDLQVVPKQGFRHDVFRDEESRVSVPVLMASASREYLFDVFLDLLDPLGQEVDVVLETSHHRPSRDHEDLYREHIDLPVLKSILCEHEELLLNDGCCGVAVLNPGVPLEVQFDEHKLLIVYGLDLAAFEEVLRGHRLPCDDAMKFITEAEHVHSSSDQFSSGFAQLRTDLGIDGHFG